MPKRTPRVPGSRFAVQLQAFPADQLRADLALRTLTIAAAARAAGLNYDGPANWRAGRRAPQARKLARFLAANDIDQGPYEEFLASPYVTVVCPVCGKHRTMELARLKVDIARAIREGRRAFRQLPNGSYERLCARCSRGTHGAENWKRLNARRVDAYLDGDRRSGPNAAVTREWAAAGDPRAQDRIHTVEQALRPRRTDEIERRFREGARRPSSPAHRQALSIAAIRRLPKKPFYLCPLCWLVTYETQWHHACQLAWRSAAHWGRGGIFPSTLSHSSTAARPQT
jgi:hypothetical protein